MRVQYAIFWWLAFVRGKNEITKNENGVGP